MIKTNWYQNGYRTEIPIPVPYKYIWYSIWYPFFFKFGNDIFDTRYRYMYFTNLIPIFKCVNKSGLTLFA
ncbi:hypothetical protein HanIR_Chr16g0834471 [Helianthus annuus]|nr:hypothetical protein HanIR_Chr16g0834471 [Helianthus annuus]